MEILSRFASTADRVIRAVSKAANAAGLAVMVLMGLLTFFDVIGRAAFNRPISGAFELTELMFVTVVALLLGYSVILKSHIRIDLLVSHFPRKAQTAFDALSHLVTSAFFLVVSWRVAVHANNVQSVGTTSGVLAIPIFPVYYVLAFGCLLIGIMYLAEFIKLLPRKVAGEEMTR